MAGPPLQLCAEQGCEACTKAIYTVFSAVLTGCYTLCAEPNQLVTSGVVLEGIG
mgnify:CR=1 FL=1|jgi:hypothetical protein